MMKEPFHLQNDQRLKDHIESLPLCPQTNFWLQCAAWSPCTQKHSIEAFLSPSLIGLKLTSATVMAKCWDHGMSRPVSHFLCGHCHHECPPSMLIQMRSCGGSTSWSLWHNLLAKLAKTWYSCSLVSLLKECEMLIGWLTWPRDDILLLNPWCLLWSTWKGLSRTKNMPSETLSLSLL